QLGLLVEQLSLVAIAVQADGEALQRFGTVDGFLDISPPTAAKSTHIKSCILALRHSGRVSLMGGLRGKWMYDREAVRALIKMVEVGLLRLGERAGLKVIGKFALEDWDSAFTAAEENPGMGV
ncbi:MAG: hypothetical protein M1830_008120, partial [Pleopsidium flavum]